LPITKASSTSQSPFFEPFGNFTSSFGPVMALIAFMNTTGSAGIGRLDSLAWSA